jgi:hypothetical protein
MSAEATDKDKSKDKDRDKKQTTEAQKEASRANGARSRGPKTPEGKERASLAKLKHGLCSERLFLPDEDPLQYEILHQGYLDDWKPQTATGLTLVEKLARAEWAIRRARRSDHGVVSTNMRNAPGAFDAARDAEHSRLVKLLEEDPRTAAALLRLNGPGCRFLIKQFETFLQALNLRGWWEPSEHAHALAGFGKVAQEVFDDDLVHAVCFSYLAVGYAHWGEKVETIDLLGLTKPEQKGAEWEFRRRLARLEKAARNAEGEEPKQKLRDYLTREIAALKAKAAEHELREAANRADAPWCVAVDVSRDGQARSRHEAKHERQFHTALRDLMALEKCGVEPGSTSESNSASALGSASDLSLSLSLASTSESSRESVGQTPVAPTATPTPTTAPALSHLEQMKRHPANRPSSYVEQLKRQAATPKLSHLEQMKLEAAKRPLSLRERVRLERAARQAQSGQEPLERNDEDRTVLASHARPEAAPTDEPKTITAVEPETTANEPETPLTVEPETMTTDEPEKTPADEPEDSESEPNSLTRMGIGEMDPARATEPERWLTRDEVTELLLEGKWNLMDCVAYEDRCLEAGVWELSEAEQRYQADQAWQEFCREIQGYIPFDDWERDHRGK